MTQGIDTITGKIGSRPFKVFMQGHELSPDRSLAVVNHSPDGFMWGYHGSGPAQLALAILLELVDEQSARAHYQEFKRDVIAGLDTYSDFEMPMSVVLEWIAAHIPDAKAPEKI